MSRPIQDHSVARSQKQRLAKTVSQLPTAVRVSSAVNVCHHDRWPAKADRTLSVHRPVATLEMTQLYRDPWAKREAWRKSPIFQNKAMFRQVELQPSHPRRPFPHRGRARWKSELIRIALSRSGVQEPLPRFRMGSRSFHPLRHLRRFHRRQEAFQSSLNNDKGEEIDG